MAQPSVGFAMQSSGLAFRRGGQSIKPLSADALKAPGEARENTAPTPRTARGHLLAGLRTAPKSAAASTFAESASNAPPANSNRKSTLMYGLQEHVLNSGPKTSVPQLGVAAQHGHQHNTMSLLRQPFTPDQILAPPEIHIDDQVVDEHLDPDLYAKLVQHNLQLSQQRQMLQQQLFELTQAQQQLGAVNMNGQQSYQNLFQQQQLQHQAFQMQTLLNNSASAQQQPTIYTCVDPATGQQVYYIDQGSQPNPQLSDKSQFINSLYQQQQHNRQNSLNQRVSTLPVVRKSSPLRRNESPADNHAPLPPPSANAFRRGHKKAPSLTLSGLHNTSSNATQDPLRSAGPKTPSFPPTPMTGGYGPGQARAGEHPIRQPRGPPSIEELKAKPSAQYEGSKNFSARTRRSALNNLMKAGLERRKCSSTGSNGSISPVSETVEEAQSLFTDNDSESGGSGSGSLNGEDVEDVEPSVPSSRTSTGSWGAIGSDRPSSRQKARNSADSVSSGSGDDAASNGSFASVFKQAGKTGRSESPAQKKTAMMVLTCAEKRKGSAPLMLS